ncbi:MAG: hypothetical protein ABI539_05035 [Acidobacteriota bacterium]
MLTKAALNAERKIAVSGFACAWMRLAASVSLAMGAVLFVTSLIISVLGLIDGIPHEIAGTLILIAAFILFGLGAHLLDCHDQRQARKEEF